MPTGTILVADDDAAIRTVLNQALSRAGYTVRLTSNASTLWRWVSSGDGDLVILVKQAVVVAVEVGEVVVGGLAGAVDRRRTTEVCKEDGLKNHGFAYLIAVQIQMFFFSDFFWMPPTVFDAAFLFKIVYAPFVSVLVRVS